MLQQRPDPAGQAHADGEPCSSSTVAASASSSDAGNSSGAGRRCDGKRGGKQRGADAAAAALGRDASQGGPARHDDACPPTLVGALHTTLSSSAGGWQDGAQRRAVLSSADLVALEELWALQREAGKEEGRQQQQRKELEQEAEGAGCGGGSTGGGGGAAAVDLSAALQRHTEDLLREWRSVRLHLARCICRLRGWRRVLLQP